MIESLQDQGKLKCCMCKKVLAPTENYYTAPLPVKPNWDYPIFMNVLKPEEQARAVAYICEECGDDDYKNYSHIIWAIEITSANEVVYHEIAWRGKEICIILDTPKLTEKQVQEIMKFLNYWGGCYHKPCILATQFKLPEKLILEALEALRATDQVIRKYQYSHLDKPVYRAKNNVKREYWVHDNGITYKNGVWLPI